jgi:hypothetical protein
MHQNHALFGLDPAVVHMAIKAPDHAPADLKARIALAVKRAKEDKTFAPMPKPIAPVKAQFKPISFSVPQEQVGVCFSYTIKEMPDDERISLAQIMKEVAEKYCVTVDDIRSARRTRAIMRPRLEFYYRARTETLCSYPAIGKFCGNRDHTTVISGAKKHAKMHGVSLPESDYGVAA